jgi:hypothetical protein
MRVYTREFKQSQWPETSCAMFEEHRSQLDELCLELDTLTIEDALDEIASFQEHNADWFDVTRFIPAVIIGDSVLHDVGCVIQRRQRMFGWTAFGIRGIPTGYCTVLANAMYYYAGTKAVRQTFNGNGSWLVARTTISNLFLEETKIDSFKKYIDKARETLRAYELINNIKLETE